MANEIDLKEFGERVERLCNYLLLKTTANHTEDVRFLQKLKEDAANIQVMDSTNLNLKGLTDYIQGFTHVEEKQ